MTHTRKILIIKLLTGHFLRKMDRGKGTVYVLYDKRTNPIEKIRPKLVESIDKYLQPKFKLWKKKHGKITFNLSTIRQLHGKNMIKQLYKKRDSLSATHSIYKSRNGRKKIKQPNEKVNYLF